MVSSMLHQEKWKVVNLASDKINLIVGDHFSINGRVLKVCYVSTISGVVSDSGEGSFFTLDENGYVERVANSIPHLLDNYVDKGILQKVYPIGFDNGEIVFCSEKPTL